MTNLDALWRQWRHTFSALAAMGVCRASVDFGPLQFSPDGRSVRVYLASALLDTLGGDQGHVAMPVDSTMWRMHDDYRAMTGLDFGRRIEDFAEWGDRLPRWWAGTAVPNVPQGQPPGSLTPPSS